MRMRTRAAVEAAPCPVKAREARRREGTLQTKLQRARGEVNKQTK